MGYSTDFWGDFSVTPTLTPEHAEYLRAFSRTRRMKRNAIETEKRPDPVREAVGLPVGLHGGYFVGEGGHAGQGAYPPGIPDVMDYNSPPPDQPGLWCQWVPNDGGTAIEWDEGEKFYEYVDWIRYLIRHFLGPWGYRLNGQVEWKGEDPTDLGRISIYDNVVSVDSGRIVYGDDA